MSDTKNLITGKMWYYQRTYDRARMNRWAPAEQKKTRPMGFWDRPSKPVGPGTPPNTRPTWTTKSTKSHPFLFPHTPSVLLPPLINLSLDRFLGVMGPFKLQGERGHRGVAGYLAGVVAFWRFTGSLQQSCTSCSLALKSHYAIDIKVKNEDSGRKKGITT